MTGDPFKPILAEFGGMLVTTYKRLVRDGDSRASGALEDTAAMSRVDGAYGLYQIVLDLADHWKYVEGGRRAGARMPPVNKIEIWLEQKGIVPKPKMLKSGRMSTYIPRQRSLAFAIAKKIARDGIKPKPYLQRSIDMNESELVNMLEEALSAHFEVEFSKIKPYA